jgi:Rv0078B-related antitoxin
MDPEMAEFLRAKTGAERLQIAFGMFRSARRMIASQLRAEHPDWDEATLEREVGRRVAGGSG